MRSGAAGAVRVNAYINGAGLGAAGRRVVLDASGTLEANMAQMARKLGLEGRTSQPIVYTKQGIRVEDVDEVIEGEALFFEPHGQVFVPPGESSSRTIEEGNVSFWSSAASVDAQSTISTSSRRRKTSIRSRHRPTLKVRAAPAASSTVSSAPSTTTPSKRETPVTVAMSAPLTRANSFEYDYQFKFVLLGSVAVGKTCLLHRFIDNSFIETHETTVGVDFGTETIPVRGKERVKLQIWDTAGQEYFKAITKSHFRGSAAALIVYDVTNRASFNDVPQWLEDVRNASTNPALTIMLVANKVDVPDARRQTSPREGEAFAREHGLLFLEASSRTGHNVPQVFESTAEAVLRKIDSAQIDVDDYSQGVRRGDFVMDWKSANRPINLSSGLTSSLGNEESGDCYC